MKKNMLFLTIMLSAIVLAGCGNTNADTSEIQTPDIQAEAEEELQTEEPQSESLEGETNDDETEMVSDAPDQETLEQMIGSVVEWAGLLYMHEGSVEIQTLTVQEALPMVGHAIRCQEQAHESGEIPYDTTAGAYIVSPEITDIWTQKYFGTTYDISALVSDGTYGNRMVSADENGNLMLSVGDWGTIYPSYEIAEITELGEGQYIVSVHYGAYEYDADTQSEPMYHIDYTLEKNEASEFGYIIVNIVGTSLE